MWHKFHRLGICFGLISLFLFGSKVSACQGLLRSERSIEVGRTWANGTAPAIKQLRDQNVKVEIYPYNEYIATVFITNFAGYTGRIELDIQGWLLVPEFELLLFFISKSELPKKVIFGEETIISIGKVVYSFVNRNDLYFTDYLAVRRAENYLTKILVSGYILETAERCDYDSEFTTGNYCFDSTEVKTLPSERTTITLKYLSENQRDNTLYEIREASFFQGSKKFNGRSKSILFVSSFSEFIVKKPIPDVSIAIVLQLKSDFINEVKEFNILIPLKRIWFGQKKESDGYCQ